MSFSSRPGFWRSPPMVARVFSCAPPTTSRVMTWVTRMASFAAAQLGHAFPDGVEFRRIGWRVGEVDLVIPECLRILLLAPGDFAKAVGDLKRVRMLGLQHGVVSTRLVQFAA